MSYPARAEGLVNRIIIVTYCEHAFPLPSLGIRLYCLLLPAGLPDYIQYQYRAVVDRFLLVAERCSSMWRSLQEYIVYEFVLTSPVVYRMSFSSNLDGFVMDGRWPSSCNFVECCLLYLFNTARSILVVFSPNTKIKVRSPDGHTDYFDIVAGVLQGDTLAPYLFIICLDYVLRTFINLMKENSFTLARRRRRYPAQIITDADYADDIALVANTPTQAESLLDSLEQVAGGISVHMNADKTEYVYFNQRGDISILRGGCLKLEDKFTYLGSSVSSTENDINTRLVKA